MTNSKILGIALVAVVIATFVGVSYPKTPVEISVDKVVSEVKDKLGAVTGPNVYSDYFSINGVTRFYNRTTLTQASSTICAIRSPAATSTLVSGAVHIDINTTASTAVIGKATTPFATTTLLAQAAIAAGTELNLVASTSPISNGALTFSPNTYMVVSLAGSGAVSLNGDCSATFEQIAY